MKSLSKYNITLARKINLPDFLVGHGYQLIDEGSGNFRVKGFQGLIVKEHYWYRHSTKEYGNAIDFIMKFEDRYFYDAVSRLLNIQPCHDLLSWQFLETTELVKNYLTDTRKIDSDIVNQLISQNKIKQDRANSICFLGYDANGRLAYIFRRSINSEKTFKGEVKHSSKEHSFQIIMKNNLILPEEKPPKINTLYIVEGAIDACALATLLKIKGKKDETIKIITTAGHPHHSLKSRIENSKPDRIIIATDMDEQGRKFANIIKNEATMAKFSWEPAQSIESNMGEYRDVRSKTMIEPIECSTPIYDAKDPAELLLKIKTNEQK